MLTKYQQNEKKFHCNQCSESFNRNFSLTLHTTVVHNEVKTLECIESGKVYNLEGLVKCSTSNSSSTSTNSQRNIKPTTKSLETKDTQCAVCKKSFSKPANLKVHVATVHNKERQYKCEVCIKSLMPAKSSQKTH